MKGKKIIVRSYHGFTKAKSCLTNLTTFYNEVTAYVDDRRAVGIAYLDFSKAFDIYRNREANEVWAV